METILQKKEKEMLGVAINKPAKEHIRRKEEHTTKIVVLVVQKRFVVQIKSSSQQWRQKRIKTPRERNHQGFMLIDITVLDEVLSCLCCPECFETGSLYRKMKTEEKDLLLS